MNEYKKLGQKKPGLWMEFFFIICFFFVGEPGLGDGLDWLIKSDFLSTLPFSSPFSGAVMSRMAGQDGTMTGWDSMRFLGQDNMRPTGQDEMGWYKVRMTG